MSPNLALSYRTATQAETGQLEEGGLMHYFVKCNPMAGRPTFDYWHGFAQEPDSNEVKIRNRFDAPNFKHKFECLTGKSYTEHSIN